jgi:hypothetical protein
VTRTSFSLMLPRRDSKTVCRTHNLIFIKTSFPLWDEMQGKLHVLIGFGI